MHKQSRKLDFKHASHSTKAVKAIWKLQRLLYTSLNNHYLQKGNQREKCTLNVTKHTFQVSSALFTTKSALTVQ